MPWDEPGKAPSDIQAQFNAWAAATLPPRTRIEVGLCDVLLLCSGHDEEVGLYCTREAGHEGQCYSRPKGADFTPVGYL